MCGLETNMNTLDTVQEGGCACGAVRFRVRAAPQRVGLCHCMTCRKIHGSAFGVYAVFERGDVEFSGHTSVWESSQTGRRHFCPVCGSVAFMDYLSSPEIDVPHRHLQADLRALVPPPRAVAHRERAHRVSGRPAAMTRPPGHPGAPLRGTGPRKRLSSINPRRRASRDVCS
jgi:hypothetical protein